VNIKMMTKKYVIGPVLGILLGAGILIGCTNDNNEGSSGESATEQNSGAEHGSGGESGNESGNESGGESGGGSEEGSAAMLAPDETFDVTRNGARLVMSYDPADNTFKGTVANTTNNTLTRARIEVHLSNGTELGPTTPVDLAPGEVMAINLPATQAPFTGWVPHAEVGSGEGGGEGGGEHGSGGSESGSESGGEGGNESGSGESGVEAGEAAMSSPITGLGQTWNGNLGGLDVSARYDAATKSVQSTVQNTLPEVLCYVQAEPHLKSGTQTVGELGPDVLGHLGPGQQATSSVSVSSEPSLTGVAYDGYVVHLEVFDCGGSGPVPHTGGEGAEGGGGEGAGGEGHGAGGEGGSEGSEGGGS